MHFFAGPSITFIKVTGNEPWKTDKMNWNLQITDDKFDRFNFELLPFEMSALKTHDGENHTLLTEQSLQAIERWNKKAVAFTV